MDGDSSSLKECHVVCRFFFAFIFGSVFSINRRVLWDAKSKTIMQGVKIKINKL